MTERQIRIRRLVTKACNTSFDCGAWTGDDRNEEPYKDVLERFRQANEALLHEIAELEAGACGDAFHEVVQFGATCPSCGVVVQRR